MFKRFKFKRVLVVTLALVMMISTIAVAANNIYSKKLLATHGRIKFAVDGKDMTEEIEGKYNSPAFTVKEYGDRSYVPVRSIAELMGLEIEYDDETHTANIIDTKSNEYENEIKMKDEKISKLDKENEKLKKELDAMKKELEEKEKKADIKVLQEKLNKDYGYYENVEFEIILKESGKNVDVTMETDFISARNEYNWNRVNYSSRKTLIENITDDIGKEFVEADITGTVYDKYNKRNLMSFNKKKNSNLSISYSASSDLALRDLDQVVDLEFYNRLRIGDAYVSNLDDRGSVLEFDIDFSNRFSDEWKALSTSDIEYSLDRIANEVAYYDGYYTSYDYYGKDIRINIYMDNSYQGQYYRYYNSNSGIFR